jgi:hypothetical protein
MKALAYGFSLYCAVTLVFGTILMMGGNHIGDFIIVCSAIGSITSMYLLDKSIK